MLERPCAIGRYLAAAVLWHHAPALRHTFKFPRHIQEAVRTWVRVGTLKVDPRDFPTEPLYTAALLQSLSGTAYEDGDAFVHLKATMTAPKAEKWAGSDFAITATVSQGQREIKKAILTQAKFGTADSLDTAEWERLITQVRDMQALTRSPKVLVIPTVDGVTHPRMLSGVRLEKGLSSPGHSLADYFVARVLTTLDGDTRPRFVHAVQDGRLRLLEVEARIKGTDELFPVRPRDRVLA